MYADEVAGMLGRAVEDLSGAREYCEIAGRGRI